MIVARAPAHALAQPRQGLGDLQAPVAGLVAELRSAFGSLRRDVGIVCRLGSLPTFQPSVTAQLERARAEFFIGCGPSMRLL